MSKCFAILDAASDQINAVAARWVKNGEYALEGFCRLPSKGLRKGLISDVPMAVDSIRDVLGKLENVSGRKVKDVYAAVSSSSIRVDPSSGMVMLSKYGREIVPGDVKKCIQVASAMKTPVDREMLHRIVKGFSVDGEMETKNPLDLEGVKMSTKVNIVSINATVLHNFEKCISKAGFLPRGFAFSGLVAAYRGLSPEDKETGAVLLDVCKEITEVVFFHNGTLVDSSVYPVGTEEVLMKTGEVDFQKLKDLVEKILGSRSWDLVEKVVLIGEGISNHNLMEAFESAFTCPVQAGTCIARPLEDLPPGRAGYIFNLGMLDYLQEERRKKYPPGGVIKRTLRRILGFLDRYF